MNSLVFFLVGKTLSRGKASLLFCRVAVCSTSFFFFFLSPRPRPPGCSRSVEVLSLCFSVSAASVGSLWRENSKPVLCSSFGAGAFSFCFFSVFGLLVALNIMSGDLRLCRECVIVEFS